MIKKPIRKKRVNQGLRVFLFLYFLLRYKLLIICYSFYLLKFSQRCIDGSLTIMHTKDFFNRIISIKYRC